MVTLRARLNLKYLEYYVLHPVNRTEVGRIQREIY